MSSVGARFDKLLSNIQLTRSQLDDAITKHTGVRKTLHRAYYGSETNSKNSEIVSGLNFSIYKSGIIEAYERSEVQINEGYSDGTSLLIGSYGKSTAIAPPSDIDILFHIPIEQFNRYDSYVGNGQSQLLQDVKQVLQKTYSQTNIKGDGQVVVVPFTSYRVEVLPAFKINGKYIYPDTHDGGSWRFTAPVAEKQHLQESNKRSKGNTIRLIKMIKAWKHYCSVPIGSLVIELRAVNFLDGWEYFDKSSMYYDWMVRDFFTELLKYGNSSCQIPGIEERKHYGDAWKSKAETAAARSSLACEYESSEDYIAATNEWKKIFGERFWYLS